MKLFLLQLLSNTTSIRFWEGIMNEKGKGVCLYSCITRLTRLTSLHLSVATDTEMIGPFTPILGRMHFCGRQLA